MNDNELECKRTLLTFQVTQKETSSCTIVKDRMEMPGPLGSHSVEITKTLLKEYVKTSYLQRKALPGNLDKEQLGEASNIFHLSYGSVSMRTSFFNKNYIYLRYIT